MTAMLRRVSRRREKLDCLVGVLACFQKQAGEVAGEALAMVILRVTTNA
jgi:hypothetical protein